MKKSKESRSSTFILHVQDLGPQLNMYITKYFVLGFAAGTFYTTTDGGANYQCMPLDPEYGEYVAGGYYSIIGGAEYETSGSSLNSVHNHNVPCARCYTHRSSTMMIPGKRSCPASWKVEYEGEVHVIVENSMQDLVNESFPLFSGTFCTMSVE